MIKAEDLMIGNLINFNWWFNGVGKVDLIDGCHGYVTMERHSDEFPLDELSPIPLTEEWLVKLGATDKKHQKGYFELGYLYVSKDEFILGISDAEYGVIEFSDEIKYVHQLQNIYYAITGKEMEVKL